MPFMRKCGIVFCWGLFFPLLIGRVGAQSPQACARIVADAARLACYDAAFGRAPSSSTPVPPATAPPVVQPPAAAATPIAAVDKFGDYGQLPRDRLVKSSVPARVAGSITHLSLLPDGLYRLTLDNAQTWQTTQSDWALAFKIGDQVEIRRLPLGGYQLSVSGNNRSVGAKRTR